MAARVNVKFVIILSVALVAVMGGVVFAAYTVLSKSGEDYAARAVEFEQVGEFKDAARSWERAVGHDRTRLEWLEGWKNALERVEYDSDAEYIADRRMHLGIFREMAEVKGADLEAHLAYLDELTYRIRVAGASAADFNFIAGEVDRSLLAFPDSMSTERATLRGYKGTFGASALIRGAELGEERVSELHADLLAAHQAAPGDADIIAALVQIDATRAQNAERIGQSDEAQTIWRALSDLVDAFVESNPNNIRGRVFQTNIGLGTEFSRIDKLGLFGRDLTQARLEALESFEDTAVAIQESFKVADASQTGFRAATEVTSLMTRFQLDDRTERIVEVWNRSFADHPEDVLVMQSRASYLRTISRFQEAIDAFQAIREMPRPPISAAGQLLIDFKRSASVSMGTCAFQQWSTRVTNAGRLADGTEEQQALLDSAEEALTNAKQYRDNATNELAEDEPSLILLNARIAFADGDIPAADRLARRYNETGNDLDPDGLRLATRIASRLGNMGEQARLLERLISLNTADFVSLFELAQIYIELRNYERAEDLLQTASEIRPDLESIKESLAVVQAILGKAEIDDPFQAAIVDAQRTIEEGNTDRAVEILYEALENNPTPDHARLHSFLAGLLWRTQDLERAGQIAEAGLEIDPNSRSLQMIKRQADIGDDADAQIAFINSMEDISESERDLRLHRVYLSQGDTEQAAAKIEAARQADPESNPILLAAFEFALRTNELDKARAIIGESEGRDVDGANGLTMRARLSIAEGRFDEAERTLTAAVERGSLNATTLSLLGRVQSLQGDSLSAIESFRRARDIRPNEASFAVDYVRSLAAAGQESEALDAARESLDVGRQDQSFVELWLALEGSVGSKQIAYDERLAMSETDPENASNEAALIRLCLDLRRFDEARTRLDDARAKRDSLALCQLDALWHMQRGEVDTAFNKFSEFLISDAEGANTAGAYLAFGAFLIDNGQLDRGLTTLRQGRRLQPDDNPIVDFELGRRLFLAGRHAEAVDVLEPIADAGFNVRAMLIECYTNLGEWDTAQARLDALEEEERNQLNPRLLAVQIAQGQGDTARARQLIDSAIAAYPTESQSYVLRGLMLSADEALLNDAIEDLTRAIELDPSNAQAYRIRSGVYMRLGRDSDATRDMIARTRARPDDDQIRIATANQLITMDREDLAADVIDEGIERRGGNLRLLVNAGRIFAQAGNHLKATQYLRSAWEQSKEVAVASMLIDSMLELPRPDLRAARQIVSDPGLDPDAAPVLMIRASIESADENWSAAERLLTDVYRNNRENPQIIIAWSNSLENMLDTRERSLSYIDRLAAQEGLSPWARFAHARLLTREEDGRSQALEILNTLIERTQLPGLRQSSLRLRSLIHYDNEDFQASLDDILEALKVAPNEPELNHNAAFVLAIELDRAGEAMPYILKAVEAAPRNQGYLDTLGRVYVKTGEPANAIEPLEQALTLASTDADRAPILVHLARARLELGDRPSAEDAANRARNLIESLDEPNEQTQTELEQVLEDINAR